MATKKRSSSATRRFTDDRFSRLFDYTKFHVGLYASLIFGVVALVGLGDESTVRDTVILIPIVAAVMCWVVAGFSGGLILGNMVESDGDINKFRDGVLEPIPGIKEFGKNGKWWEDLEHRSFWIGVAAALLAFLIVVGRILWA